MLSPKVLVVSERYWPNGGGGELATHFIVDVLRREFEVTVVTGSRSPARLPGVKYVYEPLLSWWEKPLLWPNVLRLARVDRFEKLVRKSDVVYVPRFAFPVIPRAKEIGKAVIVHLHGYIPVSYTATVLAPYEEHKHRIARDDLALERAKGVKHCIAASLLWWLPRLARKWMARADKVVCVSKRQADIISDLVPELRSKIEVIYNPLPRELINASQVKELDEVPAFLYVGGDSYAKGFHVLLRALERLGERGTRTRFVLTGEYGHKSLEALKQISERRRSLEIHVVGRVTYDEVLKLHRRAWALVFPSICEEPLPYAVIEAMALSTIPIASEVGGVPEVLEGTPAEEHLFKPRDVDGLMRRIMGLSSRSVKEITKVGIKLRERALMLFDEEGVERRIIKAFKSTL